MMGDDISIVRVELFGGRRMRKADGTIVPLAPQLAGLLALLALEPCKEHTREYFIRSLWPNEKNWKSKQDDLRVMLTGLRKIIPGRPDLFPNEAQAYRLSGEAGLAFDFQEFDYLFAEARDAEEDDRRIECLERAVELYAGPFAPGIRDKVAPIAEARRRYAEQFDEVSQRLAELRADRAPVEETDAPPIESGTPSPVSRPWWRRRSVLAAVGVTLVVAAFVAWSLKAPTPTFAERIQVLNRLREAGMRPASPAETESGRRQQAEQCVALGEEMWNASYGPLESERLALLKPLDGDIQSSLRWLMEYEPQKAVKLAGALTRYWWVPERPMVARGWLEKALARSPKSESTDRDRDRDRARALALLAICLLESYDLKTGNARQANSAALADIRQSFSIYQRLKDRPGQAHALRYMGHVLLGLRREVEAERSFKRALAIYEQENNVSGQAYTCWGLSLVRRNDPVGGRKQTIEYLLRSVKQFRQAGYASGLSLAWENLGNHIHGLADRPDLAAMPEFVILLNDFISVCKERLNDPEVQGSLVETLLLRNRLVRAASLVNDRVTAVEQLGYLCGPGGNVSDPRIVAAYLHDMDNSPNPPLDRWHAEQKLKDMGGAPPNEPVLTLEAAARLAAP